MKNKIVLFLSGLFLISCGKENKETPKVDKQDQYSVILEGIYEQDDSLSAKFEKDGYYDYNNPVSLKVKGSPQVQQLVFNFPAGQKVENVAFLASSNKAQKNLTIKSIWIKNGNDTIVKPTDNFTKYFFLDESFSWDATNSRYVLDHTKNNPPGIVGNDELAAALLK